MTDRIMEAGQPVFIHFIAAPLAGKSKQAGILAEILGLPCLDMGELLRRHEKDREPCAAMRAGGLVDDALCKMLLRDELVMLDVSRGWILVGFPRTLSQLQDVEEWHRADGHAHVFYLYLAVDNNTIKARNRKRIAEAKKAGNDPRKDDSKLEARLEAYRTSTIPLMLKLMRQPNFVAVDGQAAISEVTAGILAALRNFPVFSG